MRLCRPQQSVSCYYKQFLSSMLIYITDTHVALLLGYYRTPYCSEPLEWECLTKSLLQPLQLKGFLLHCATSQHATGTFASHSHLQVQAKAEVSDVVSQLNLIYLSLYFWIKWIPCISLFLWTAVFTLIHLVGVLCTMLAKNVATGWPLVKSQILVVG